VCPFIFLIISAKTVAEMTTFKAIFGPALPDGHVMGPGGSLSVFEEWTQISPELIQRGFRLNPEV